MKWNQKLTRERKSESSQIYRHKTDSEKCPKNAKEIRELVEINEIA